MEKCNQKGIRKIMILYESPITERVNLEADFRNQLIALVNPKFHSEGTIESLVLHLYRFSE